MCKLEFLSWNIPSTEIKLHWKMVADIFCLENNFNDQAVLQCKETEQNNFRTISEGRQHKNTKFTQFTSASNVIHSIYTFILYV